MRSSIISSLVVLAIGTLSLASPASGPASKVGKDAAKKEGPKSGEPLKKPARPAGSIADDPASPAADPPAKGKTLVIVVGSTNVTKSLLFTPNQVSAQPGDVLQFQFSERNHTVTQSTFDTPCQPIQVTQAAAAGINSGFVPVTANATEVVTFTVPINSTEPLYLYCAQGPHCQLGMVMTVNAPETGDKSYTAYKGLSANATMNVPAAVLNGGVIGKIPAKQATPPPV